MFAGSREECLEALRQFGEQICVYSMPGRGWAERCDCKYGGPFRGGELSGCPELRSVYSVVSAMTDAQWRDAITTGGHVLGTEVEDLIAGGPSPAKGTDDE